MTLNKMQPRNTWSKTALFTITFWHVWRVSRQEARLDKDLYFAYQKKYFSRFRAVVPNQREVVALMRVRDIIPRVREEPS